MTTPSALSGLLAYLARSEVPAVVVGGMAVIVHGYIRATGDVDVVMAEGPETARWLRKIADELGATTDRNGRPLTPDMLAAQDNVGLRTRHGLLDVLMEGAAPLQYEDLLRDSVTIDVVGGTLNVVGLSHLRLMKEMAGRLQDRLDLEQLQKVHGPLPEPPGAE